MELALTGIDGSGKTTFLKKVIPFLKEKNLKAGYIDLPYFRAVPGFEKLSSGFICPVWKWAEEKKNNFVLILLMVLAVFLYLPARFKMRKLDILLVEHHPRVDSISYSKIYMGGTASIITHLLMYLFPKPQKIVMLLIPSEEAYERLIKRGKTLQPHENIETLRKLEVLLKESIASSGIEYCFVEDPEPETFFTTCLARSD